MTLIKKRQLYIVQHNIQSGVDPDIFIVIVTVILILRSRKKNIYSNVGVGAGPKNSSGSSQNGRLRQPWYLLAENCFFIDMTGNKKYQTVNIF